MGGGTRSCKAGGKGGGGGNTQQCRGRQGPAGSGRKLKYAAAGSATCSFLSLVVPSTLKRNISFIKLAFYSNAPPPPADDPCVLGGSCTATRSSGGASSSAATAPIHLTELPCAAREGTDRSCHATTQPPDTCAQSALNGRRGHGSAAVIANGAVLAAAGRDQEVSHHSLEAVEAVTKVPHDVRLVGRPARPRAPRAVRVGEWSNSSRSPLTGACTPSTSTHR